ncbi:unnamed protein product, partial [Mycena citricolor]
AHHFVHKSRTRQLLTSPVCAVRTSSNVFLSAHNWRPSLNRGDRTGRHLTAHDQPGFQWYLL